MPMTFIELWDWVVFVFLPHSLFFVTSFLITVFLTYLIPQIIYVFLTNSGVNRRHVYLAEMFFGIVVFTCGLVTSLQLAGIDIIGISITLGAASIAVGIAVRDILANIIAALILQSKKHYDIGNLISVDEKAKGFVHEVSLQQTELVVFDIEKSLITGERVFFPNQALLDSCVILYHNPAASTAYHAWVSSSQRILNI